MRNILVKKQNLYFKLCKIKWCYEQTYGQNKENSFYFLQGALKIHDININMLFVCVILCFCDMDILNIFEGFISILCADFNKFHLFFWVCVSVWDARKVLPWKKNSYSFRRLHLTFKHKRKLFVCSLKFFLFGFTRNQIKLLVLLVKGVVNTE